MRCWLRKIPLLDRKKVGSTMCNCQPVWSVIANQSLDANNCFLHCKRHLYMHQINLSYVLHNLPTLVQKSYWNCWTTLGNIESNLCTELFTKFTHHLAGLTWILWTFNSSCVGNLLTSAFAIPAILDHWSSSILSSPVWQHLMGYSSKHSPDIGWSSCQPPWHGTASFYYLHVGWRLLWPFAVQ